MTDDRLALAELLEKAGAGDFLRSVAEAVLQMLMEADVEGLVGAGPDERSGERINLAQRPPRPCARHAAGIFRSCAFRSCVRGATSRRSSRRGRSRRRRWSR